MTTKAKQKTQKSTQKSTKPSIKRTAKNEDSVFKVDSSSDDVSMSKVTNGTRDSSAAIPQVSVEVMEDSSRALTTLDPITTYLNEIRKYPLLSREQEHELAIKFFETKDPEAAQALATANLRFVVKIAAEYSKFGAKMIDLIQEGNIGLMHAIREFNPYKGVRLISYAVWWIRGYIHEYMMKQYSIVKIGTTQNQRKLFYKLQKEREALEALGAEPTYALLSSRLGVSEGDVHLMSQRMGARDLSLNQPLDEDTGRTLIDLQRAAEEEPLDEQMAWREQVDLLKQKIEELRPLLSQRELVILDERLLAEEPLTLQEIGAKYNITREAVRQMENRVMKKIRQYFVEPQKDSLNDSNGEG